MGQYHQPYNVDKKETFDGHGLGQGVKLMEQVGFEKSVADALFFLLANSNDRGNGDALPHEFIGRWAGDRIVVQGDYALAGDPGYITDAETDGCTDISPQVLEMLNTVGYWGGE